MFWPALKSFLVPEFHGLSLLLNYALPVTCFFIFRHKFLGYLITAFLSIIILTGSMVWLAFHDPLTDPTDIGFFFGIFMWNIAQMFYDACLFVVLGLLTQGIRRIRHRTDTSTGDHHDLDDIPPHRNA